MTGRIHSIQSLGALDGPGVRFTVFLQGCNLRCGCCHNPDTWNPSDGTEATAAQIVEKACRYREYFGPDGGITLSGGEPLMQAAFAAEIFRQCHKAGIHTCLDTSGSILNGAVEDLLTHTDRVLLDIKYTNEEDYRRYAGCGIDKPLSFLARLNEKRIPTTLRQVIIPTLNDGEDSIRALKSIADAHSCVDSVELLPFRKLCRVKYEKMNLTFPFEALPEPEAGIMKQLEALLNSEGASL